jgi:hypothetical protein
MSRAPMHVGGMLEGTHVLEYWKSPSSLLTLPSSIVILEGLRRPALAV